MGHSVLSLSVFLLLAGTCATLAASINNNQIQVPEYIKVSSNGGAATAESDLMGIYKLQDENRNNFPAWKKQGEDLYLFVASDEFWNIGSDLFVGSYIYNTKKNPTPVSPLTLTDGWRYNDGKWKTDNTIRVEAFTVQVPEYIKVSSNGGAATAHLGRMGIYKLQDEYSNNFPVWKKQGEEVYLFVNSNKFWIIGPDPDGNAAGIVNIEKNPTPVSPLTLTDGWRYNDGKWKTDNTIRVEAFTVQVPEYIKVSSNGEVATEPIRKLLMGIYKLQDEYRNNFPVWKKQGEDQYLFVASDKQWYIGPNPDTAVGWIYNAKKNPTPVSPLTLTDGWWYYIDDEWKTDNTIRVEDFTGDTSENLCSTPILDNGLVEATGRNHPGIDTFTAKLRCNVGFTLVGMSDTITCRSGIWSVKPTNFPFCTAIGTCPDLPNIENGHKKTLRGFRNSVFKFRCNRGFRLFGPKKMYCTGSQWSSPKLPVCTKNGCDEELVSSLRHGGSRKMLGGGVYRFRCDRGSIMEGPTTVVCDGTTWNETAPICLMPTRELPKSGNIQLPGN